MMTTSAFPRPRQLLLALTSALACTTAWADGLPLATGTASLTNIRYELIDLRPEDDQHPWIQFAQAGGEPISGLIDATGLSHGQDLARQADWQGLLPTEGLSVTSADGYTQAGASANSLSTSFTVDPGVLNRAVLMDDGSSRVEVFSQARAGTGIPSLSYEVDDDSGMVTAVDGDTSWQPFDFTLSPHTAIVVHAQASASLTLNTALGAWDILDTGGNPAYEPLIGSGVQLALMLINPDFAMQPVYASTDAFYADMDQAYQLTFDGVSANWTPDDLASMTPTSRDLLIMLNNETNLEAHGTLLMTGMSQFAATRAVPEPGSWAMMGLGLLALSIRSRQSNRGRRQD